METLIKADLFFFITTIVVMVLGAFLTVAAIYLIKILRELKNITTRVKEETDEIIDDAHEFRENIKKEEVRMSFFSKLMGAVLNPVFFTKRSANMKNQSKKHGKKQKIKQ